MHWKEADAADSDKVHLIDGEGTELGYIEPQGASWVCVARGPKMDTGIREPEVVGFRPDRATAERLLKREITARLNG